MINDHMNGVCPGMFSYPPSMTSTQTLALPLTTLKNLTSNCISPHLNQWCLDEQKVLVLSFEELSWTCWVGLSRTFLACCCPCGICLAQLLSLANCLIKLPITIAECVTRRIPFWLTFYISPWIKIDIGFLFLCHELSKLPISYLGLKKSKCEYQVQRAFNCYWLRHPVMN